MLTVDASRKLRTRPPGSIGIDNDFQFFISLDQELILGFFPPGPRCLASKSKYPATEQSFSRLLRHCLSSISVLPKFAGRVLSTRSIEP